MYCSVLPVCCSVLKWTNVRTPTCSRILPSGAAGCCWASPEFCSVFQRVSVCCSDLSETASMSLHIPKRALHILKRDLRHSQKRYFLFSKELYAATCTGIQDRWQCYSSYQNSTFVEFAPYPRKSPTDSENKPTLFFEELYAATCTRIQEHMSMLFLSWDHHRLVRRQSTLLSIHSTQYTLFSYTVDGLPLLHNSCTESRKKRMLFFSWDSDCLEIAPKSLQTHLNQSMYPISRTVCGHEYSDLSQNENFLWFLSWDFDFLESASKSLPTYSKQSVYPISRTLCGHGYSNLSQNENFCDSSPETSTFWKTLSKPSLHITNRICTLYWWLFAGVGIRFYPKTRIFVSLYWVLCRILQNII